MARHRIQIVLDDDTGEVRMSVRCSVKIGNFPDEISHAEDVTPPDDAAKVLRALIDETKVTVGDKDVTLREYMEQVTTKLAINHVAAVMDTPQPGVKRIKVGGSVGAIGNAKT